jgi:hypothetical protein
MYSERRMIWGQGNKAFWKRVSPKTSALRDVSSTLCRAMIVESEGLRKRSTTFLKRQTCSHSVKMTKYHSIFNAPAA